MTSPLIPLASNEFVRHRRHKNERPSRRLSHSFAFSLVRAALKSALKFANFFIHPTAVCNGARVSDKIVGFIEQRGVARWKKNFTIAIKHSEDVFAKHLFSASGAIRPQCDQFSIRRESHLVRLFRMRRAANEENLFHGYPFCRYAALSCRCPTTRSPGARPSALESDGTGGARSGAMDVGQLS